MITECNTMMQVSSILDYIGNDYKTIPYLYVDVVKYGVGAENVRTWIDEEEGQIQGVYLLYFDCLHFYTHNNEKYDINHICNIKDKYTPKVIMIQEAIGKRLNGIFSDEYTLEKNQVLELSNVKDNQGAYKSTIASRNDIEGIVDLLLTDELYTSVFSKEVLLKQMINRFDDEFSHYTVIKDGGKIVATCSTYGETDKVALIGSVIVHPDYRHRGLAADVENYTCKLMIDEGRTNIGFVNYTNIPSMNLHLKIGWKPISTLYKFVSRQQ